MITFTTVIGVGGTLIASGVGEIILKYKGKDELATTLKALTFLGVYGYSLYWVFELLQKAAMLFL